MGSLGFVILRYVKWCVAVQGKEYKIVVWSAV